MNENKMSFACICEGCLTVGRKLTTINGKENNTFLQLLGTTEYKRQDLQFCWECAATFRRSIRFINQVRNAKENLINYMVQQTLPTSLSTLTISKVKVTHDIFYNVNGNSSDTKCNELFSDIIENGKEATKTKRRKKNTKETAPLAFIKIEEREDYDDYQLYVDENADDVPDDKKVVLKSDEYINGPIKDDRIEDEFDASDDEPLKKKGDRVNKTRGRRKKGDTGKKEKKDKIDRRKNPGPKREMASGVVTNARVTKMLEQLNVPEGQLEMVVLSWDEVEQERLAAAQSAAFTRHSHRCFSCVVGFNHRQKLDQHMAKHDPSMGAFSCSVCQVRCRDAHALSAHRRRHRVRWRCCLCSGRWSRAAVAADHLARLHGAPTPTHACPTCGHTELTLSKLRNHIKNHAERQKCELCGKSFRDRTSLKTHLFIHRGEKEFSCPVCNKRFLFKKAMEVHRVTHDQPMQLYCHECDMNFKNHMSYYQHMKYNLKHVDPAKLKYACGLCAKKFVKAARLREHHVAVHLKATPVSCPEPGCQFACASRPVLRTHARMVHRNARAQRNHVCHSCGKAYTTKGALQGHMHGHSGARPFRCQSCPAAFGYGAALYNHNKLVHLRKQNARTRPVLPASPTELSLPEEPADAWATLPPTQLATQTPDIT